jgi:hypothetical protein
LAVSTNTTVLSAPKADVTAGSSDAELNQMLYLVGQALKPVASSQRLGESGYPIDLSKVNSLARFEQFDLNSSDNCSAPNTETPEAVAPPAGCIDRASAYDAALQQEFSSTVLDDPDGLPDVLHLHGRHKLQSDIELLSSSADSVFAMYAGTKLD